ncbi:hypothetical protein BD410DRAFT_787729, partial [Rickenella mellea]
MDNYSPGRNGNGPANASAGDKIPLYRVNVLKAMNASSSASTCKLGLAFMCLSHAVIGSFVTFKFNDFTETSRRVIYSMSM